MTDAFSKNKIVFVPGKNPKPVADVHRALLWNCLLHGVGGVDAATADAMGHQPENFVLVSWNELFYGTTKPSDEDEPWIRRMCEKSGADERDRAEAQTWRVRRARWLYRIADHLQFLIPLLPDPAVKSAVRESERYFSDLDGIATRVRELVKAPLRNMLSNGDRILLIGHSMGSIIAYDALWELSRIENLTGRIDQFLTLGSPLGMHYVQRQLLGATGQRPSFPANVRRWTNIAAQGDLTALEPEIRGHFRGMLETGMVESIQDVHEPVFNYFRNENGLNVHRSYGYLVEEHVARLIADWWQGAMEPSPALAVSAGMA